MVKNELHKLLDKLLEDENPEEPPYSTVMKYLLNLSTSGIDFQLQTLCNGEEDDEGINALKYLICIINDGIESKLYFELLQAVLGRLLKVYIITYLDLCSFIRK